MGPEEGRQDSLGGELGVEGREGMGGAECLQRPHRNEALLWSIYVLLYGIMYGIIRNNNCQYVCDYME